VSPEPCGIRSIYDAPPRNPIKREVVSAVLRAASEVVPEFRTEAHEYGKGGHNHRIGVADWKVRKDVDYTQIKLSGRSEEKKVHFRICLVSGEDMVHTCTYTRIDEQFASAFPTPPKLPPDLTRQLVDYLRERETITAQFGQLTADADTATD
jgi:hypothetical protein